MWGSTAPETGSTTAKPWAPVALSSRVTSRREPSGDHCGFPTVLSSGQLTLRVRRSRTPRPEPSGPVTATRNPLGASTAVGYGTGTYPRVRRSRTQERGGDAGSAADRPGVAAVPPPPGRGATGPFRLGGAGGPPPPRGARGAGPAAGGGGVVAARR